jgi:hypothetical protein
VNDAPTREQFVEAYVKSTGGSEELAGKVYDLLMSKRPADQARFLKGLDQVCRRAAARATTPA